MKHYYASNDDAFLTVELRRGSVRFANHSLILDDEIPEQAKQQKELDKGLETNPTLLSMFRKLDLEAAEALAAESVAAQQAEQEVAHGGTLTAHELAQASRTADVLPSSIREAAPDVSVGSEATPHTMRLQLPGSA